MDPQKIITEENYVLAAKTETAINIFKGLSFGILIVLIMFLTGAFKTNPVRSITILVIFFLVMILAPIGYYYFKKRYTDIKWVKEGDQKNLKQKLFIIGPLAFISLLFLAYNNYFIEGKSALYSSSSLIIGLIILGIVWFAYYTFLKKNEKEKGIDTRPILTKGEIIFLIIAVAIIIGMIVWIITKS